MKMKSAAVAIIVIAILSGSVEAQWVQASGPRGAGIYSLAVLGNTVLAGTIAKGIYRSTNNGDSWKAGSGAPAIDVRALAVAGTSIFAATYGMGVYVSSDTGANWTAINTSFSSMIVNALAVHGTNIFAGTSDGAYISTNNGASWDSINNGLSVRYIYCITVSGDSLFAGTQNGGVFLSTNDGALWSALASGIPDCRVNALVLIPAETDSVRLFAGTDAGLFVYSSFAGSWSKLNPGCSVHALIKSGNDANQIYAGTDDGVYRSTDKGSIWTAVNTNLRIYQTWCIALQRNNIFAGTEGAVFLSTNHGANWKPLNDGMPFSSVIVLDVSAGAAGQLYAGTNTAGFFRSTDNGENWTELTNGLDRYVNVMIQSGGNIILGTDGGTMLSTDQGDSWVKDTTLDFKVFVKKDGKLYGGTSTDVLVSTDDGVHWASFADPLSRSVTALAVTGSAIFAGLSNYGVYMHSDLSPGWIAVNNGLIFTLVQALIVFPDASDSVFVAVPAYVYRTTNNGVLWTRADSGLTHPYITSFASNGRLLFVASADAGIYMTTNCGAYWTNIGAELPSTNIWWLAINNTFLYAGLGEAGMWRRSLSDLVSVAHPQAPAPKDFSLKQNFPNPFSSQTTIQFSLPKAQHVTLEVYDLLGRKIAALVDEGMEAGMHHAAWDAGTAPAGLYSYRLKAGEFNETKMMISEK